MLKAQEKYIEKFKDKTERAESKTSARIDLIIVKHSSLYLEYGLLSAAGLSVFLSLIIILFPNQFLNLVQIEPDNTPDEVIRLSLIAFTLIFAVSFSIFTIPFFRKQAVPFKRKILNVRKLAAYEYYKNISGKIDKPYLLIFASEFEAWAELLPDENFIEFFGAENLDNTVINMNAVNVKGDIISALDLCLNTIIDLSGNSVKTDEK